MRSARTCAPMRAADRLRTTCAVCRRRTRVTDSGSRNGRAVGRGEANSLWAILNLAYENGQLALGAKHPRTSTTHSLVIYFVALCHSICGNRAVPSRRAPSVTSPNFPRAFRTARVAVGIPQEAFDTVSSRTYVSILERGVNVPTLTKIDALVRVLGLHPLTVLTLAYAGSPSSEEISKLQELVAGEIASLGVTAFSPNSLPRGKTRSIK